MATLTQQIVIVGGGTAGWLSALHIKSSLGDGAQVTLIESPDVPTIGVGEGTQPTLRVQLHTLRVEEDELLRHCGASFKNGIRFVDWCRGTGPSEYLHPFFSGPTGQDRSPYADHHLWLALQQLGQVRPDTLADACFAESVLIRQQRAPIGLQDGKRLPNPVANYAYHIDAAQLGLYLRKLAIQRGVIHAQDYVEGVRRNDHGDIVAVQTRNQGEIPGDFFVDCSGFHRLLIGQLADDFVDFSPCLLNDRAVTARIPYNEDRPQSIHSCTTSTAMPHGWIWEVPLRDRVGMGYVYSSQFVSDEEARRTFVEFIGHEPAQTNLIRFQSGYYRQQWNNNCVAIGLSGGFIEPLEATGIALITYSLFRLLELWPTGDHAPVLRDRFNSLMGRSYEWIRDFIVMHYCLSQRDDTPYWQAVRQPEAIPDSLQNQLEMFRHNWPFGDSANEGAVFHLPNISHACVLAGFHYFPHHPNAYILGLPAENLTQKLAPTTKRVQTIAQVCPDHRAYLDWLNGTSTHF